LPGSFVYSNVLSLTSTFVTVEAPDSPDLLDRARGGDAEAFCELCRTHETRLLRQAIALCGNSATAEDLAQDTLVEAWKCLWRYNGKCRFFTWLCAILLNRYRNALRAQRLRPAPGLHAVSDDERVDIADTATAPDHAIEAREEAALIRKCVESLAAKHQRVVFLRFYAEESIEGIAAALGCSVGTVKSRLFHALEKLRKMNALRDAQVKITGTKENL
jgi:RNA polymerase sigma-70 factor (ECF subfamily)